MTEVRRATVDDAAMLAAVYRSAYAENRRLGFPAKAESATEDEVAGWIRDHLVLVATDRGSVVGGVRLERTDPEEMKLSRLAVHDDHQAEGIGGMLLDEAEAAAIDRGCAIIWLTTPGEHPSLPDIYRARGYERTGTYPLEYRDYDEMVMEKPLG